ncbi:MAG: SUF system NifU family Fe-S cluster assembly protein [Bacilli bacterium]|nr:SUF system NifU family Fe-S cluster assembly protein [Bacilli bacterium]
MDVKLKRDIILDNYQNPANKGLPNDEAYEKVNSRNESCVDNITVAAKVIDGKIEDVKFDGDACAICTSASSVMTKELKGKSVEEAELIIDNFERMINELPYNEEVLGELNIYNEVYKQPSRKKCALLPMGAIKKIIDEDD